MDPEIPNSLKSPCGIEDSSGSIPERQQCLTQFTKITVKIPQDHHQRDWYHHGGTFSNRINGRLSQYEHNRSSSSFIKIFKGFHHRGAFPLWYQYRLDECHRKKLVKIL